jgi:hypothetical protein
MGKSGALTVLNTDTGKLTDTVSVPADADDLAFDQAAHRLYYSPAAHGMAFILALIQDWPMSALGQKRSFSPGHPNVRFAQKADIRGYLIARTQ